MGTTPLSNVAPLKVGAAALKYTYMAERSVAFTVPVKGTATLLTTTGSVATSSLVIYTTLADEFTLMAAAATRLVVIVTSAACIEVVPAILLWLLVILGVVENPKPNGLVVPFMMIVCLSLAELLILAVRIIYLGCYSL